MAGFRIICLAVAVSAVVGGARTAHASSPKVAVLGLEVIEGGESLDQQTAQRAAWLTEELRAYASSGETPYELAPDANKDLLEMKLLSGCADEKLECMAAIGRELGADHLLYGKLKKGAETYRVSLVLLDTRPAAVRSERTDEISFTEASKSAMAAWARGLYNELTGVEERGALVIETNTQSGTVFVDGRPHASLSEGRVRIQDLEQGPHTVSIEAEGYAPYAERVTLRPGEDEVMRLELDRTEGEESRPGGGFRIAFGATAVTAGATGGAWLFSFMQMRSAEEDRSAWFADPNNSFEGEDCTRADDEELRGICSTGTRYAQLSNIFGAAAAATTLAAGYFYYKGFVGAEESSVERDPDQEGGESWSFKVNPRFGPDLMGAGLRLEF